MIAQLSVRRGAEAIDFYERAFGAVVEYRVDAPDGAVVAQLSVDGSSFWVADESPSTATSARTPSVARLRGCC